MNEQAKTFGGLTRAILRSMVKEERCPTCTSNARRLHPAMQRGGQPCRDIWHPLIGMLDEIEILQNELSEARKDSARLDWIEAAGSTHLDCEMDDSWSIDDYGVERAPSVREAIDAHKRTCIAKPVQVEINAGPTISVNREWLECPACRAHTVLYDTANGEWYCRGCGEDGAAGTYWQRLGEVYRREKGQEKK